MRRCTFLLIAFGVLPELCLAHPGHLAEVAGHGHWVAGAAIGAAIVIGLWAGLKGRGAKAAESEVEADQADADAQEPEAA